MESADILDVILRQKRKGLDGIRAEVCRREDELAALYRVAENIRFTRKSVSESDFLQDNQLVLEKPPKCPK